MSNVIDFPKKKKIPPNSETAEWAVLYAVANKFPGFEDIFKIVQLEDFYFEHIARLFQAAKENRIKEEDLHFLNTEALNTMGNAAPTLDNFLAYASIVREKSLLRELIKVGKQLIDISGVSK